MRAFFAAVSICLFACSADVPVRHQQVPITQRVADACSDVANLCTQTGNCIAQQAFCGTNAQQLGIYFAAEDTCKLGCSGITECLQGCKAARYQLETALVGTSGCDSLSSCTSVGGAGCSGGEFFCIGMMAAPSPCATQLADCKAACVPHDRTCLHACRDAYKQCLAGTTVDAGVADAAPKPDAAMPDAAIDAAPKPDAPPTTTSYTYTTNIYPVTVGLCNGCHSGGSPPGNYLTTSYANLFGNGSDNTPNIIAGDATSLFVQKIQGNHHNVLTLYPGFDTVAYTWVVKDNAVQ